MSAPTPREAADALDALLPADQLATVDHTALRVLIDHARATTPTDPAGERALGWSWSELVVTTRDDPSGLPVGRWLTGHLDGRLARALAVHPWDGMTGDEESALIQGLVDWLNRRATTPTDPAEGGIACPCCDGDPLTVCAACDQHACWAGRLMCDESRTAGTYQATPAADPGAGVGLAALRVDLVKLRGEITLAPWSPSTPRATETIQRAINALDRLATPAAPGDEGGWLRPASGPIEYVRYSSNVDARHAARERTGLDPKTVADVCNALAADGHRLVQVVTTRESS